MADNFNLRQFLTENKLTKNAKLLKEGSDYGYDALMDVVDVEYDGDEAIASAVEDAFNNGDIDTSEFGHDLSAPSRAVAQIANGMDIEAAQQSMGFEEGVEGEEVPENPEDYTKQPGYVHETLTANEKRLVEMVQDAMGYTNNDEDQEFDPGHDIEQAQHNIERQYEGDEMADETVIPEYHSIDELMKGIEHGTNKVAEEHKIQEMKKIAEALRAKVKNLEEGEHAKHIDQKAVKQFGKDIAALEKTAAKLQAAFDKKFNKKEKAVAPKKAEKVEALQEGAFDLKKFLIENKLTRDSRRINEEVDDLDRIIAFLTDHGAVNTIGGILSNAMFLTRHNSFEVDEVLEIAAKLCNIDLQTQIQ
jgi:hypothetical protein